MYRGSGGWGHISLLLVLARHRLPPLQCPSECSRLTQVGSPLHVWKSSSSLNENILNLSAKSCTLYEDTSKEAAEDTAVFYALMANIGEDTIVKDQTFFFKYFPIGVALEINGKRKICLGNRLHLKTQRHKNSLQYHRNLAAINIFLYYQKVIYIKVF